MAFPVSVFLITKNEAANLPRCLDAINELADEIVIVDSGSTDRTQDVAAQYGARFSVRPFDGFGQQKFVAEQLCRNDWVLNLDADEVVTPELYEEICDFFEQGISGHYDGARLKTVTVYPGWQEPRPFSDYHNYIRLYRKSILNFPQHPTHDAVIAKNEGRVFQFKEIAKHYSYPTLKDLKLKARRRTGFYFEKEKRGLYLKNLIRLPIEFPFAFFKSYILRRHVFGGWPGLYNAYIYAKYRFIRILQRVIGKRIV